MKGVLLRLKIHLEKCKIRSGKAEKNISSDMDRKIPLGKVGCGARMKFPRPCSANILVNQIQLLHPGFKAFELVCTGLGLHSIS